MNITIVILLSNYNDRYINGRVAQKSKIGNDQKVFPNLEINIIPLVIDMCR